MDEMRVLRKICGFAENKDYLHSSFNNKRFAENKDYLHSSFNNKRFAENKDVF